MRISDWSSDVCSSDLRTRLLSMRTPGSGLRHAGRIFGSGRSQTPDIQDIAGAGLIAIAAAEAVIAGVQQQIAAGGDRPDRRTEERRVGTECVSTSISRWSEDHEEQKIVTKSQAKRIT